MLSGFKQFVLRGNVVDLAVGVVIGAAFGTVVSSFVKAFITPLVALIVGKRGDFSGISYTIRGVVFPIGDFVTALVSFVLVAAAIYFFVVTPINALIARTRRATVPPDPTTKKCPECMSEIPIDARRCSQCTQPLMGKAA
jgi:large conductance mechanosensitive channel